MNRTLVCDEWSEIPDNSAKLAHDESSQIPAANEVAESEREKPQ